MNTENNISLLKLYYDEWKYRLDNYRKQIYKIIIVIFFTTTLPISIGIFDKVIIPNIALTIYPLLGLVLTIVFFVYCCAESSRICALDKLIKLIISDTFDNKYKKDNLQPIFIKKFLFFHKMRITIWLPIILMALELVIVCIMFVFINKKYI